MKNITLILFAITATMVSCRHATNEEAAMPQYSEEKETTETPVPAAIQTFSLASRLAFYGHQNESATALIEAASIMADLDCSTTSHATAKLLAAASELALDDPLLLDMIRKIEERMAAQAHTLAERGPTGSVYMYNDVGTIPGHDLYEHTLQLQSGYKFNLVVDWYSGYDLNVRVYHDTDSLVYNNEGIRDKYTFDWKVDKTGAYTIKIINKYNVSIDFMMSYQVDRTPRD